MSRAFSTGLRRFLVLTRCPVSAVLLAAACLAGCAGTRYELLQPRVTPAIVQSDRPVKVSRDSIDYELLPLEEKLVVRFSHMTEPAAELLPTSQVFDARGSTYPIEAQVITKDRPGRLILPPRVAQVADHTPPASELAGAGGSDDQIFYIDRRPLESYRQHERTFDWPADQTAKLVLDWKQGEHRFTHEFVIKRSRK